MYTWSLRGHMQRREFITLLGGAAAAWPLAARAQQPERMRRIGVLLAAPRTIRNCRPASRAFPQGLELLGWTVGRNVRIDTRWAATNPTAFADSRRNWSRSRRTSSWPLAADRGAVAAGDPHRADRVRGAVDPVGAGFVDSLSRPGGNVTGFMQFEYGLSAKWLELLKEIAPGVTRAASFGIQPTRGDRPIRRYSGRGSVVGVELSPINVRDAAEIERGVAAFARAAMAA